MQKGMIEFTPDPSIRVHKQRAVELICQPYRSHEDGQPEWLKNSSDQYKRMNWSKSDSIILFLFRTGNTKRESAVACIDFGGMSTADIETKFSEWFDPDASVADDGSVTEGGHGNGGKCYMTQLFSSHSYLHTVKNGRASKYGFVGGDPQPGYFPNPKEGRGFEVTDIQAELNITLNEFGLDTSALPAAAIESLTKSNGFTAVVGFGAKPYEHHKLPITLWKESLQGHQQAKAAIEHNRVFLFANGSPLLDGNELCLPEIEPLPAAPLPREVEVPALLPHPDTANQTVDTGSTTGAKLVLRTSKRQMTHKLRSRHTI